MDHLETLETIDVLDLVVLFVLLWVLVLPDVVVTGECCCSVVSVSAAADVSVASFPFEVIDFES